MGDCIKRLKGDIDVYNANKGLISIILFQESYLIIKFLLRNHLKKTNMLPSKIIGANYRFI